MLMNAGVRFAGSEAVMHGALLAGLIAGAVPLMGYLVTVLPDDFRYGHTDLYAVGAVRTDDPILPVDNDEGLIHGVKDVLDKIPAASQCLFHFFAFRYVLHRAAFHQRFARGVIRYLSN